MTPREWADVWAFVYGRYDGTVPHLSLRAWRYVYALWEACILPEEAIRALS